MRTSFWFRPLSAMLLFLVALSAPGTALAHGWAHHEEHHEERRTPVAPDDAVEVRGVAELSAPDHAHEHTHARVDEASRPRLDVSIAAPVPTSELPAARVRFAAHHAAPVMALVPPGDPHTGPPPRVRAPPSC